MCRWLLRTAGRLVACSLGALAVGCGSEVRLSQSSSLCVDLTADQTSDPGYREAVTARLDKALSGAGYAWSQNAADPTGRRWYFSEPRRGPGGLGFDAVTTHLADGAGPGERCDVQLGLHATRWRMEAASEWERFLVLRDSILPDAVAHATVRTLEHPGLRTRAWEVRDLSAQLTPDEQLPLAVRQRIDLYEKRWSVWRWWDQAMAASRTALTTWSAEPPWERPGATLYGPSMYFALPPNWIAFAAFALAVLFGRKLWTRAGAWRTAGFLSLAVLLLMPVKVPTWAGWLYLPHGYVQAFDFDPLYYAREAHFALAAALGTAGLAWLLLALLRRLAGRGR